MEQRLDDALGSLDDTAMNVALLQSQKEDLERQLESTKTNQVDDALMEEQRMKLAEMEEEIEILNDEKDNALRAVSSAQVEYAQSIADRQSQVDTLNKDVEVHREQMELAQTMLEEKEQLASELRAQLEETVKDEELRVAQLEEDLAAKSREVNNVTMELEERNKDVDDLEEKLEKSLEKSLEQILEKRLDKRPEK